MACLTLLLAAPALASAEGGDDSPLQAQRWYNAIWALSLFLTLAVLVGRFAWKPVNKALEDRERVVTTTLADAQRHRDEGQAALDEYRARLAEVENEASALLNRTRQQADTLREEILVTAKKEAQAVSQQAQQDIHRARQDALEDIYRTTAELATQAAGKIIQREIRPEDHRQLILQSLQQLKKED